ncbi:hypothetical protein GQ600_1786 [Phytophthora cactorum]|nr:hypothetical protein GQ600_1786 [Phytophthora cactorum]
MESWQA